MGRCRDADECDQECTNLTDFAGSARFFLGRSRCRGWMGRGLQAVIDDQFFDLILTYKLGDGLDAAFFE